MLLKVYMVAAIRLIVVRGVSLPQILEHFGKEITPESLHLYQNESSFNVCWNQTDLPNNLPKLIFKGNETDYLKKAFNAKVLVLVCFKNNNTDIMNTIYTNLDDMRDTFTILFASSEKQIRELFLECLDHKMLNVLAFKGSDLEAIYSFKAFPDFKIQKRNISEVNRLFEPQLKDLGGYVLKGLPDNIFPRTVVYRDKHGSRQMAGYLAHLIKTYTETINATLQIVWNLVPEKGMTHLSEGSQILDIDLPIGVDGLYHSSPKQTVPIQISNWFLILPMEKSMPKTGFFLNLGFQAMIPLAVVLGLLLNNAQRVEMGLGPSLRASWILNKVLRGVLAQPFILPRYLSLKMMTIYWLILISGFFMSNYYTADLATMLMNSPKGIPIRSWEQLRRANLKILISQSELNFLNELLTKDYLDKFVDLFKVADSEDYQRKRTALNQSYAYPATLTLWPVLEESQKRLETPIFRKSEELILTPFIIMAMPLPKNSIFKKSLYQFVRRSQEFGLFEQWYSGSFKEAEKLGIVRYKKDNEALYRGIEFHDFYFVWIGYLGGISIGLVAFILELIMYRKQRV
ncbi:hypothetical protein KR026_001544 [Drosophila bipectinata]|nr:hypothetical protein KR026_001544 [Drosophila bipectinata]